MSLSVLALVQTFTDKSGLPRPSVLVSGTDNASRQYRAIMRETIADLGEFKWQQQHIRTTFTSVALSLQGTLAALLGAGYAAMVKDSMWNDTRHMQIFGPVTEQQWQLLQTLPAAGPEYQFWIGRDNLYISPVPRAGDTISAIYITKYNVLSGGTGTTYIETVTNDADTLIFPDHVVLRVFEAKWKKQKGESGWEDDYNDAMALVARNIVKDGAATLQLDNRRNYGARPGITIPPGSWGV